MTQGSKACNDSVKGFRTPNITCTAMSVSLLRARKRSADLLGWNDSPFTRLLLVSNLVSIIARVVRAMSQVLLGRPSWHSIAKLPFATAKAITKGMSKKTTGGLAAVMFSMLCCKYSSGGGLNTERECQHCAEPACCIDQHLSTRYCTGSRR